jgi:hypothetical protein
MDLASRSGVQRTRANFEIFIQKKRERRMVSCRSFLIALALVIGLGAVDGRASQKSPLDRTLIVGTKEAPPFAMKDSAGAWTGISIQLWRLLAADLNLRFEFRELDLQGLLDGVKGGSLDAAVAALTITPEREQTFDFTHPFYTTGLGIAYAPKHRNPWLSVLKRFLSLAFLKVVAGLSFLLLGVGILVWWFERRRNPGQFGGRSGKGIGAGLPLSSYRASRRQSLPLLPSPSWSLQ